MLIGEAAYDAPNGVTFVKWRERLVIGHVGRRLLFDYYAALEFSARTHVDFVGIRGYVAHVVPFLAGLGTNNRRSGAQAQWRRSPF